VGGAWCCLLGRNNPPTKEGSLSLLTWRKAVTNDPSMNRTKIVQDRVSFDSVSWVASSVRD
jgi:hypothetical protein